MKDTRENIIYLIGKLMMIHKPQRFFQLLCNYTQLGDKTKDGWVKDPFYISDSELEKRLFEELLKCQT